MLANNQRKFASNPELPWDSLFAAFVSTVSQLSVLSSTRDHVLGFVSRCPRCFVRPCRPGFPDRPFWPCDLGQVPGS
ncbi:hypothetical protein VTN49DRAFT_438 [Thermomyces lanuginosus]|uniref:uncharacterized protein n=1 Tax=Thermomyces lanuginosus TaxID=5541 RepID=UPI003742CCA7